MVWAGVEDARCFAVVRWHYENGPKHSLRVWIGETVRVRGETKDWFLVTKTTDGGGGEGQTHNQLQGGNEETGIVPRNHLLIRESYVLPFGECQDNQLIIPRVPPLVQEITDVLKEWHRVAKKLYLSGQMRTFEDIRARILQLHVYRSSITSPDLTVDGRRELKKLVAEVIDKGNSLLGLDMSVRDEAGNTLNPNLTSTVELYRQHAKSREKLENKSAERRPGGGAGGTESTLSIAVTCRRMTWKVVDRECQVRLYLYDADEEEVFTEGALMSLKNNSSAVKQAEQQQKPVRFIFTDLGSRDIERSRVFLIAYIVRIGAMEFKEEKGGGTPFTSSKNNASTGSGAGGGAGGGQALRRPWGVAARDITQLLKQAHKGDTDMLTQLSFVPYVENESLKSTLIKCIEGGGNNTSSTSSTSNNNNNSSSSSGGSGKDKDGGVDKGSFHCLINVLHNHKVVAAAASSDSPTSPENGIGMTGVGGLDLALFGSGGGGATDDDSLLRSARDVVVRKMGFPEVILPNDVRNELYVRLSYGEFHRGAKTADKNVQVSMSCHNERGELIRGILCSGNNHRNSSSGGDGGGGSCDDGGGGLDTYRSLVYYHDDKPKWYEFVKVSLPMVIEEFSSTHLKFTFKHRSSSESKDRAEKPFALAYFILKSDKGTAVVDAEHKLRVYKIDGKQYRESDVSYLKLPSLWPTPGSGSGSGSASSSSSSAPTAAQMKSSCPGLSFSQKDSFSIRTTLCSTKFTQNVDLLELLQWSSKSQSVSSESSEPSTLGILLLHRLHEILLKVARVCGTAGEEIVKFLPDIFDALFHVLVKPVESMLNELGIEWNEQILAKFSEIKEKCDRQIFECLICIFEVVLRPKYQKFRSVLSHYIDDGFTATLAYKQLIKELEASFLKPEPEKILRIMKSFEFFFRFIIRSFSIRLQLEKMNVEVIELEGEMEAESEFEHSIVSLFSAITSLVARKEREYLAAQGAVLRFLPSIIEQLTLVFDPMKLSELFFDLLRWMNPGQLVKEKLSTIGEIVKSSLFRNPDCRTTLQPIITLSIREHLPGNDNELRRRQYETTKIRSKNKITQTLGEEAQRPIVVPQTPSHSPETMKCVELLSDMMDILYRKDIGPVNDNITYIMHVLMQPLIQSIATIGEKDPLAGNMVAILLALFRQMNKKHYMKLISQLRLKEQGLHELYSFINELLLTLRSLCTFSYFPPTWSEMVLLSNSIVLAVLKEFSEILKGEYSDEASFDQLIWTNLFSSLVYFLSQESLSLAGKPRARRLNILNNYGDMRKEAANLLRLMWFSLGQSKRYKFVPSMVGIWLHMAFVREPEIQRSVIPILFDMMRCEFEEEQLLLGWEPHGGGGGGSGRGMMGGGGNGGGKSIVKMEDELVKRLVELIEAGHGDSTFHAIFKETMYECCNNDNSGLQALGLKMVNMLSRLIDLLLEFRHVLAENEIGNTMNCIVNLLDFSMEIGRKELYLRYLYKLHELHVRCGHFTEAAFTIKLHSRQLEWSEEECSPHLSSPLHPYSQSQWEVKEGLYYDIINYFDKAKMWECALDICDELRSQYAEETYNYALLSSLLSRMSSFYTNILKGVRCDPEYFRVAFFGTSFPSFLQDKGFVYRGKEYEKLSEFEARMLERFPKAELLRSLNRPSEEIRSGAKQYLQICKVDPLMNTGVEGGKRMSGMRYADESIRKYYKVNNVNKFVFSRPYHKEPKDPTNEFASLWLDRYTLWTSNSFPGIMNWFPIIKECSQQVKPIVKAIESMDEVNEKLREMVLSHVLNPQEDLGGLTMKLSGILDAAVMGGIKNYESAFLSEAYLEREPGDRSLVDRLKTLICHQVPIVYQCLLIHEKKAPDSLQVLHRHLQDCYNKLILHMNNVYGVALQNVEDESLKQDIERALRRKLRRGTHEEPGLTAHPHSESAHSRSGGGGILARGKNSFSSTMSLYSSGFTPKLSGTKSMVSIPKSQRRSTQGSLDEGKLTTVGSSMAKLAGAESFSELNRSRDSSTFFTNTSGGTGATTPLPTNGYSNNRMGVDNRRSFTWTSPPSIEQERRSTHSLTGTLNESGSPSLSTTSSLDSSSTSTIGGGGALLTGSNSTGAEESEEQELAPPPLPPKQHLQMAALSNDENGSALLPPKPPPKPPLRISPQN